MQRRKDIYGPDADEFRPERWEEDSLSSNKALKWAYVPFNGGPRICLGSEYLLDQVRSRLLDLSLRVFPSSPQKNLRSSKPHMQLHGLYRDFRSCVCLMMRL